MSVRQSLGRDALGLVPPQASQPKALPATLAAAHLGGDEESLLALGEELAFRSGRGADLPETSRRGWGRGAAPSSPHRLPATEGILS